MHSQKMKSVGSQSLRKFTGPRNIIDLAEVKTACYFLALSIPGGFLHLYPASCMKGSFSKAQRGTQGEYSEGTDVTVCHLFGLCRN